jgi:hypothetical protein
VRRPDIHQQDHHHRHQTINIIIIIIIITPSFLEKHFGFLAPDK